MRANLATALGVGPKQDLPPIMFQTEVADVSDQMGGLARGRVAMSGRGIIIMGLPPVWPLSWARAVSAPVLKAQLRWRPTPDRCTN